MAAKSALKRQAPSSKQLGPPKKKLLVSQNKSIPKNRPKADPTAKKRRLPVTATAEEEPTDSEEEADDFDEDDDLGADGAEETMGIDEEEGTLAPPKDPNGLHVLPSYQKIVTYLLCSASRESHKVQKELAKQRQATKPHADVIMAAKRQWNLARQRNLSQAERQKHVAGLMDTVRGKVQDVVFKHDASRIIQTVRYVYYYIQLCRTQKIHSDCQNGNA
jgi:pumilio homology domain family member 6